MTLNYHLINEHLHLEMILYILSLESMSIYILNWRETISQTKTNQYLSIN